MVRSMFGVETELAVGLAKRSRDDAEQESLADAVVRAASSRLPNLRGRESAGIFLATGGRLYRDAARLEITSPESTSPWELCRYLLASERLLADVVDSLRESPRYAHLFVSRCNVCYAGGATSGCHESYQSRSSVMTLAPQLIPFLVSRVHLSGAGGFDNLAAGLEFSVSPRVRHLEREISDASTHDRGIFHTKNESLARNGFHRLHVLSGEHLSSIRATWLKIGCLACVVALVDGGVKPGGGMALRRPLAAMNALARDTRCRVQVELADGRMLRGLDIQRHYLELVEQHAGTDMLPEWAAEVCQGWRVMLDRLEGGWQAVSTTLDWAIKRQVFSQHARRRGFTWKSVEHWNRVARRLARAVAVSNSPLAGRPLSTELLAAGSPICDTIATLTPWLMARGLEWEQFGQYLALRSELFETDTRFSQLGEAGIFNALDAAGVLDHAVPGVDNIEHAMTNPPAVGRAHFRGEAVNCHSAEKEHFACDWSGVWNMRDRQLLDLSDPWAAEPAWRAFQPMTELSLHHWRSEVDAAATAVGDLYARGHYEDAHTMLQMALGFGPRLSSDQRRSLARHAAWLQARRGYLDGPAHLDGLLRADEADEWLATDYVCVYRFEGLVPLRRVELDGWVARAKARLQWSDEAPPTGANTFAFRDHYGRVLLSDGRPEAAVAVLQIAHGMPTEVDRRIVARMLATLADAQRRLGQRCHAVDALRSAQRICEDYRFDGDLADFVLPTRAKLCTDTRRARTFLSHAKELQASTSNRVGMIRSMLLEARCQAPARTLAENWDQIVDLSNALPSLATCPLLAKILERWDAWTARDIPAGETDFFWGV